MDLLGSPFMKELTPGGVGIWVLVFMFAGTLWKGLPKIIDAVVNRRSKIEERLGLEIEAMSNRFAKQLEDADHRHEDCVKGQEILRDRIDNQDMIIAEQGKTIAVQNKTIADQSSTIVELNDNLAGLRAQYRQSSASIVELLPQSKTPAMERMTGNKA